MSKSPEYDYIIIGGGTAGLVIANRLSADPNIQVLVLEAGDDHLSDFAGLAPCLWKSRLATDVDWNYATVPQPALNNRSIAQPQGRAIGGSSSINALAFTPPSAAGMDYWQSLGNPGWGWADMKPYYTKFRNLTYPDSTTSEHLGLDGYPRAQGGQGPIKASFPGTIDDPIPNAWIKAFEQLGWIPSTDLFSGTVQGGFSCAASIDSSTKTRSHSGTAYYLPVRDRPNLTVEANALVEKIVLEKKDGAVSACGVRWTRGSETQEVMAAKEVILAAGAYGSPKLLELSGIGDPKLLSRLGIDIIVERPSVGKNLQDHLMIGISFEVKEGIQTLDDLRLKVPGSVEAAVADYQTNRTGPLAKPGIESYSVMPVLEFETDQGKAELAKLLSENPPDQQIDQPVEFEHYNFIASTLSTTDDGSGAFWLSPATSTFGSDTSILQDSDQAGNFVTIGCNALQPFSRGSTHISSSDAQAAPAIDMNYLHNPLDLEVFARHLMFVETLARSDAMRAVIKDPENGLRNSPLAKATTLDEAKKYVASSAASNWHPVGTCMMAPREKGGVVGHDLRVHGVSGLRVVDSSIMPVISRGNPQTTVYAVAERAADIILGLV